MNILLESIVSKITIHTDLFDYFHLLFLVCYSILIYCIYMLRRKKESNPPTIYITTYYIDTCVQLTISIYRDE